MLRQPRFRASIASPAQKMRGLSVVYSKTFSRATFVVFYVFEQFARETKFEEKAQCEYVENRFLYI